MLLSDIARSVKAGIEDYALNEVIRSYIIEWEPNTTVREWKIANYAELRRWSYPDVLEFVDAQVKIAQGGSLKLEGNAALSDYMARCYKVKLKFPKV